ncbi:MAG: hypothetical protein RLZ66_845, partial [Pseudomonadota bacterium]
MLECDVQAAYLGQSLANRVGE